VPNRTIIVDLVNMRSTCRNGDRRRIIVEHLPPWTGVSAARRARIQPD
jgi:hypothetical protein